MSTDFPGTFPYHYEKSAFVPAGPLYFADPRRRSALVMTETELRLIASAATIGDRSCPVNG